MRSPRIPPHVAKRRKLNIPDGSIFSVREFFSKKLLGGGLIPTEIRQAKNLSLGAKVAYSALAEMEATMSEVRPSVARIAHDIGCGTKPTRNYLHELQKAGLLRIELRVLEKGNNQTNKYHFRYAHSFFEPDPDENRSTPDDGSAPANERPGAPKNEPRPTPADDSPPPTESAGPSSQDRESSNINQEKLDEKNQAQQHHQQHHAGEHQGGGDGIGGHKGSKPSSNKLTYEEKEAIERIQHKIGLRIDGAVARRLKHRLEQSGDFTLAHLAYFLQPDTLAGAKNPVGLLMSIAKEFDTRSGDTFFPACFKCDDKGFFLRGINTYYCWCERGRDNELEDQHICPYCKGGKCDECNYTGEYLTDEELERANKCCICMGHGILKGNNETCPRCSGTGQYC